jgi:hypothetical protein
MPLKGACFSNQIEVNKDPYGLEATLAHYGVRAVSCQSNMTRETVRRGRNMELVVSLGIQESARSVEAPFSHP